MDPSTSQRETDERASVEIERKYLLDGLPKLPDGVTSWQIEQGYLPQPEDPVSGFVEGRIRRTVGPDGHAVMSHTVKRGDGVERSEVERPMTADEFELHWPDTHGRRVKKVRHRVRGSLGSIPVTWEIDQFLDRDLVLAEVEIPAKDVEICFPDWLAPHVVREVTDDRAYRNYSLATGDRS
jgi:CYTH domain-containing protein